MNIEAIKAKALQAIWPLKAVDSMFYGSHRTAAGRGLPEHYLVYFLLVDLLGFKNLGRHEKLAWSIPVELEGQVLFIEHRKLGLGVFTAGGTGAEEAEPRAMEVVSLVNRGIRAAGSYFDWRAEQAVNSSKINVRNKCDDLYQRFEFLLGLYNAKIAEVQANAGKRVRTDYPNGGFGISFPEYPLSREAEWLAISVVESFFSWTEHAFVHLAILQGKCVTGGDVNSLSAAEWKDKFKTALDLNDPATKGYYDRLTTLRYEVRNFVAHGAFGKSGQAFLFHSGTGAVPVQLPHRRGEYSYRFPNFLEFIGERGTHKDHQAIACIQEFVDYIRSGPLAPAWMFLDERMDSVLTHAQDGTYELAMKSKENMQDFIDYQTYLEDMYSNMDFPF